MLHSKVFIKHQLSERVVLLLHSDPTGRTSSSFAVGLGAPEKVRKTSLTASEGGRGASVPSLGQVGCTARLWPPCSQMLRNLGPVSAGHRCWKRSSKLFASAASGTNIQTDRNVLRAPSWPGTQQQAGRVASTEERRLPFPIMPPQECT